MQDNQSIIESLSAKISALTAENNRLKYELADKRQEVRSQEIRLEGMQKQINFLADLNREIRKQGKVTLEETINNIRSIYSPAI